MFEQNPENSSNTPKAAVLLAEDDTSVRRFLEIILSRAGYDVHTAEDGLAAMKIAFETKIDAIVSDAMMPNLSGFDLLRTLRQNENYKTTPFIILTGFDTAIEGVDADACITKGENLKEELSLERDAY